MSWANAIDYTPNKQCCLIDYCYFHCFIDISIQLKNNNIHISLIIKIKANPKTTNPCPFPSSPRSTSLPFRQILTPPRDGIDQEYCHVEPESKKHHLIIENLLNTIQISLNNRKFLNSSILSVQAQHHSIPDRSQPYFVARSARNVIILSMNHRYIIKIQNNLFNHNPN